MIDSDLKLLELMALEDSIEAQTKFYNRYRSFLLQICRKRCAHFQDGDQLAEDIFQNTMLKALKGSKSLYARISGKQTETAQIIKAWLIVIARNELRNFLKSYPDQKYLADLFRTKSEDVEIETEMLIEDATHTNKKTDFFQKNKLDEALSKLSDRERHILMVYMEYYNEAEPNRHLPDTVIRSLCDQYETTTENLRQIKGRAMKKLMEELQK